MASSVQSKTSMEEPIERGLFPFEKVRGGQKDVLEDARIALREGKHLLADAPTGLGKTVVALTASLEVALDQDKLVLFLTSRQSQHKAAIDTILLMNKAGARVTGVDVIAKQAMCQLPEARKFRRAFYEYCNFKVKTKSCPWHNRDRDAVAEMISKGTMHVHELISVCRRFGVCPHKTAMTAAGRAHVLVCDYNYIFSDVSRQVLKSMDRDLNEIILVVDEAHNLPDRVRSHLCGDLSPRDLKRGIKESKPYDAALSKLLRSILISFLKTFKDREGEEKAERALFLDLVQKAMRKVSGEDLRIMDLIVHLEEVGEAVIGDGGSSTLMEIANFMKKWNEMDDGMVRIQTHGNDKKISYKLLDPSILSAPIFKDLHSSIIMSGTLHPVNMYRDLLGLEPERTVSGHYPSPFPKENRSVVVTPNLTSLYAKRTESMYEAYAQNIIWIAEGLPGNIAVFFPSYAFLQKIKEGMGRWKGKDVLQEKSRMKKEEKTALLDELKVKKEGDGAILMDVLGGSLSEGIDYKNNLLHSVVVVGLPLSPPSIENQALKHYYSDKFGPRKGFEYSIIHPALNKVLQAAGRCIRSEKDKAIIFLMDSRFAQERYSKCMPQGFDFEVSRDVRGNVSRFSKRAFPELVTVQVS
ncbi:MAG: ATP-dependent DNA helicase [Thermoplasmata archaeon]